MEGCWGKDQEGIRAGFQIGWETVRGLLDEDNGMLQDGR